MGMKFDTIRLYLGSHTPKLHVKLDSHNRDASMSGIADIIGDSLDIASYTSIYENLQIEIENLKSENTRIIKELDVKIEKNKDFSFDQQCQNQIRLQYYKMQKFVLQVTNNSTDTVSLDAAAFKNIGGGYGSLGATSIAVASGTTTFSLGTGGVYSTANVGTEVYLRTITGTDSTYSRVGTISAISSNAITVNSTAIVVSAGATLVFSGQLTQVLSNNGTTADFSLVESVDKLANTSASFQMVARVSAEYVNSLATQRSTLGAYQNQIEYTVSNVQELSANLSAARSNVQDTDYATETAALTKGQILQQAATAMLAQANQMPNVILSLLK
jgi:flagellin